MAGLLATDATGPRCDALAVSETKITNFYDFQQQLKSFGLGYVGNARDSLRASARSCTLNGGGVGILYKQRPDTTVVVDFSEPSGAIGVTFTRAGYLPIAIIAVYIPTTSSRNYRKRRLPLLAAIRQHVLRLRQRLGEDRVLILGDFNTRYYRRPGTTRHFHDVPEESIRKSTADLHHWAASLGVEPVHGRTPQTAAYQTYRYRPFFDQNEPFRYSELDYIFASASAGADKITPVRLGADAMWESLPNEKAHRPLACDVALTPAPPAAEAPAADGGAAAAPTTHIPAYNHPEWFAASETVQQMLSALAHPAAQAEGPEVVAQAVAALRGALNTAVEKHLRSPAKSVRTWVHRRLMGASISPPLVAALQEARRTRRVVHNMRAASNGDAAVLSDAAALFASASKLQKLAISLATVERLRWQRERVHDLQLIRPRDVHGLFKALRRIAPEDFLLHRQGGGAIPSNGAGTKPLTAFYDFFSTLLRETRLGDLQPAAASAAWGPEPRPPADVPAGGHDWLARTITAKEVFRVVFPPMKKLAPEPCHPACVICKDYCAHHASWDAGAAHDPPRPEWQPRMHTSKAAGPDGIPPEIIRFARSLVRGKRLEDRLVIAQAFADVFNAMLRTGHVDAAFAASTISPLLKPVKSGQPAPDAADPNNYRGIAVGNVTAKIFSAVLTARLYHWATLNKLISPEQVGFSWRQGTEWHVYTLRETLKHRFRNNLASYALFVDLKKAYDRVHLGTLWRLLADMGVPAQLLSLLRNWSAARTARVRVNGELTPEMTMSAGVPQGDPLSPLLFNLFIECLSRYLATREDLQGVTISSGGAGADGSITIRHLLYADDIVVIAASPQELQRALGHIQDWCSAYGMSIGTGAGKTEAVPFIPPAPAPAAAVVAAAAAAAAPVAAVVVAAAAMAAPAAAAAPPLSAAQKKAAAKAAANAAKAAAKAARDAAWLTASEGLQPLTAGGGVTVQWQRSYRYLGHLLHFDLQDDSAAEIRSTIAHNWSRYFQRCPTVMRAPLTLQLQLFRCSVQGAVNTLRAVVPLTSAATSTIDKKLDAKARVLLGVPPNTAGAILLAEARLFSMEDIALRDTVRLGLQFELSPHRETAIAPRLHRVLSALPQSPPHSPNSSSNADNPMCVLAHVWRQRYKEALRRGVAPAAPAAYWDISRAAHVVARAHAYARATKTVDVTVLPGAVVLPPLCNGSRKHMSALTFGMRLPLSALGTAHGRTPLSVVGPCCSGSLVALSDRARYPAIAAAQLGRRVLRSWPFADGGRPGSDAAAHASLDAAIDCPACGAAEGSLYHLVTECGAASSVTSRVRVVASLASLLQFLLAEGTRILRDTGSPGIPAAEAQAVTTFLAAPPPAGGPLPPQWCFVAYWCLMAVPWPRSAVTHSALADQLPAAAALGGLFDALCLPPSRLRAWASRWVRWADDGIVDLARTLRTARGLPPRATFPRYGYQPRDPRLAPEGDADDVASQDGGEGEVDGDDPFIASAEGYGVNGFIVDDGDDGALLLVDPEAGDESVDDDTETMTLSSSSADWSSLQSFDSSSDDDGGDGGLPDGGSPVFVDDSAAPPRPRPANLRQHPATTKRNAIYTAYE